MKIVALISGGKDSCYNMMQCVAEGHDIIALANLAPNNKDEMDSYMYQTVGHHVIDMYAQAMGVPLYRRTIHGLPLALDAHYTPVCGDEVEDLYELLSEVKHECDIEGVSVGAILSDYQRVRVENVCSRLGLTPYAFLWRRDQKELLREMIDAGIRAIIIKVAALGLEPSKHLGKSLKEIYSHMLEMNSRYGLNICGEGGEYETITLDCPLFHKSLVVDSTEIVSHSDDAFAPVAYLNLRRVHCEDKHSSGGETMPECLSNARMLTSVRLMEDLALTSQDLDVSLDDTRTDALSDTQSDTSKYSEAILANHKKHHVLTNESGEFWITGLNGVYSDEHCTVNDVAKSAFNYLQSVLTGECEADMCDIISVSVYLNDMDDYTSVNAVYERHFATHPPVRLCVGMSLAPRVCLRLDVYGCTNDTPQSRRSMHVRSISHWAPACIGHYSQAIQRGRRIHVSGQIGLCPSTNALILGGVVPQSRLSLRHVSRVLEAMHAGTTLHHCVNVMCFVTDRHCIRHIGREWNRALEATEGDRSACSVRYTVVDCLPRGALVEWSVEAESPGSPTTDDQHY